MMKKKEILCVHNYCDSCLHVLKEQNKNYDSCSLDCFSFNQCKNKGDVCKLCGQKLENTKCENDFDKDIQLFQSALENKKLKVICFTAPSVRVGLGDEFGFSVGENVQGKMIGALKTLGAYQVFDMNIGADFTITEEAYEFKQRLENNGVLPMFTSCCPGWVSYLKKMHPEYKDNLSTCKSPQQMFGSLINNYYVEKNSLKPTDVFIVSIVPCYAKKLELKQQELNTNIGFDVDIAITTNELVKFLKEKNIDLKKVQEYSFDNFFGESSGAGAIFGNTGGVLEAVLRSAGDHLENEERKSFEFKLIRGLDGIRRADVKLKKRTIKVAVVSGLRHLNKIFDELKRNPNRYDLVEVMACDGGCIGGPGQPIRKEVAREITLKNRAKGLYEIDKNLAYRKAHVNPAIIKVYDEYLGEVGGEKAKKLLHRKY